MQTMAKRYSVRVVPKAVRQDGGVFRRIGLEMYRKHQCNRCKKMYYQAVGHREAEISLCDECYIEQVSVGAMVREARVRTGRGVNRYAGQY